MQSEEKKEEEHALESESRYLWDPGIPDTRKICTKVGSMLNKLFQLLVITYKKVPKQFKWVCTLKNMLKY